MESAVSWFGVATHPHDSRWSLPGAKARAQISQNDFFCPCTTLHLSDSGQVLRIRHNFSVTSQVGVLYVVSVELFCFEMRRNRGASRVCTGSSMVLPFGARAGQPDLSPSRASNVSSTAPTPHLRLRSLPTGSPGRALRTAAQVHYIIQPNARVRAHKIDVPCPHCWN